MNQAAELNRTADVSRFSRRLTNRYTQEMDASATQSPAFPNAQHVRDVRASEHPITRDIRKSSSPPPWAGVGIPNALYARAVSNTSYGSGIAQSGGRDRRATPTPTRWRPTRQPSVNYVSFWDFLPVRQLAGQWPAPRRPGCGHNGTGVHPDR